MLLDNLAGLDAHTMFRRDLEWYREQLARFTYKPGWKFSIKPTVFSGVCLFIAMDCEDTYNPGQMITIAKQCPLTFAPYGDPEPFAAWLAHEIKDVEIHESREWLKRDGMIYDDPHKNGD